MSGVFANGPMGIPGLSDLFEQFLPRTRAVHKRLDPIKSELGENLTAWTEVGTIHGRLKPKSQNVVDIADKDIETTDWEWSMKPLPEGSSQRERVKAKDILVIVDGPYGGRVFVVEGNDDSKTVQLTTVLKLTLQKEDE